MSCWAQITLFSDELTPYDLTPNEFLAAHHYLGPIARGSVYRDEFGLMVFSTPTSRRLPTDWLELARWCIKSEIQNAGSRQWRKARAWLAQNFPSATTVISYSDPSQGHTGALYRACNWLWAPTWHRLRTPPSGNGSWNGSRQEAAKDRWVFPLRPDPRRLGLLAVKDSSITKRFPGASFIEKVGANFKAWVAAQ